MNWTQGDLYVLARLHCAQCSGLGGTEGHPCACVTDRVFQICVSHLSVCLSREISLSTDAKVTRQRNNWSRKDQEYVADCLLVARRALCFQDFRVFRMYFVDRVNWRECCKTLGLTRRSFWSASRRIVRQLGRALGETKPYALFPVEDYYTTARRSEAALKVLSAAA